MFQEVELVRPVIYSPSKKGKRMGHQLRRRLLITCLLHNLLTEKASEDHGYFLTVTRLKYVRIGEAKPLGLVPIYLTFNCRTFMPLVGEILHGVVWRVCDRGVFLRCGPAKVVYLSTWKMPNYRYVSGEKPFYLNDEVGKLEVGAVVRFLVLAVRWTETRHEFEMLASIEGDSLGLISFPESDEIDL